MRKLFKRGKDSTADARDENETTEPAEAQTAEPAEAQSAEPVSVVAPVQTTAPSGETKTEWATLGKVVPVPQAVPASARYVAVPSALSEVSAASVARILGGSEGSTGSSGDEAKGS